MRKRYICLGRAFQQYRFERALSRKYVIPSPKLQTVKATRYTLEWRCAGDRSEIVHRRCNTSGMTFQEHSRAILLAFFLVRGSGRRSKKFRKVDFNEMWEFFCSHNCVCSPYRRVWGKKHVVWSAKVCSLLVIYS